MDLVMPITAAFVTPYTKRLGTPVTLEATLDMLMMLPWPTLSMAGRKARVMRYIDVTLRSSEKAQAASSQSRIVP